MKPTSSSSLPFYQPLQLGEGKHQWALLNPVLRPYISSCWEVSIPAGVFDYTAIPDTCQHLVSITIPNRSFGHLCLPAMFPLKRQIIGPAKLFGITFMPGMRKRFIPVEIKQHEQIQSWSDLSSRPLNHLEIALNNEPEFQQKVNLVELWVTQQLQCQTITDSHNQRPFLSALQSIKNALGNNDLNEHWARERGVSSRHLRRLFLKNLDMTPKQYADIVRFQSSIQIIEHQGIDALYQSHCYYDQSHLIRQFKKFTGLTPRDFKNLSVLSKRDTS
ncbi:helix-turn-helix domain-containing protein [Photobacterium minamisatsumaniensis]|uniref:helix-turn-helix domain-containing protein n=1 Tax=Photobacterium minamisatsumaniensis TaxID=2910233 RepID=UPI003D0E67D2